MSKYSNEEKSSIGLIIIGVGLILMGLIFFVWIDVFNINYRDPINSEKFGQFGDFVGGIVGSVWALAGVILFYSALKEQRLDYKNNQAALNLQVEALNNQIKEFELQRNELESSRKIYEEQSKTLRIQQFESNFYSLLNVYLTIKDNLNNLDKDKDFFKSLCDKLPKDFNSSDRILDHHLKMVNDYVRLYEENKGHLSHYFKCFYRVLKVIDTNNSLSNKEKTFYSKILRSQLTDYEQLMLYYNSHSRFGVKSRPLILKYNLLKHTPIFNKPEFKYFITRQTSIPTELIFFADRLGLFLINHIGKHYELDFEADKIEEEFEPLNCIVGIYFNNQIELRVFCKKDILENNIELKEAEFSKFIFCCLFEKLVLSTYLDSSKIDFEEFKTETSDNKIFGLSIKTEERLDLNFDKF